MELPLLFPRVNSVTGLKTETGYFLLRNLRKPIGPVANIIESELCRQCVLRVQLYIACHFTPGHCIS
jgi:hypothetical protein